MQGATAGGPPGLGQSYDSKLESRSQNDSLLAYAAVHSNIQIQGVTLIYMHDERMPECVQQTVNLIHISGRISKKICNRLRLQRITRVSDINGTLCTGRK